MVTSKKGYTMVKLIDQEHDVLVFAGHVIPAETQVPQETIQVKMAKSSINNVHPRFSDFFAYVSTPRYKAEVYQAIVNAGGNIEDIDRMLQNGQFRVVSPGTNDISLDSLANLRLVPTCHKVKVNRPETSESLAYLGEKEDSTSIYPVDRLFAAVLYAGKEDEDFPTTVRRLGIEMSYPSESAILRCFESLDEVLTHKLAHWDNLTDPPMAPIQPRGSLLDDRLTQSYKASNPFARLKTLLKL
jgi:hypothetical protein